jgi:hypothetical protein
MFAHSTSDTSTASGGSPTISTTRATAVDRNLHLDHARTRAQDAQLRGYKHATVAGEVRVPAPGSDRRDFAAGGTSDSRPVGDITYLKTGKAGETRRHRPQRPR